ncbi:MAG: hypothetical protein IJT37_01220, partial [Lachnospiraceae bacterium]|nr:hypothetical protein [Lachnospiraceae bacterium]
AVPEPEYIAEAEPAAKPAAKKKVVKKAVKKVVKKPAVTAVPVMTGEPEYTAEPDIPYTAEPDIPYTAEPEYVPKPAPGYMAEPEPAPMAVPEPEYIVEAEPEAKPAAKRKVVKKTVKKVVKKPAAKPAAKKKVVKKAVKKVVKKPAVTAVPVMTGEPEYTAEPDIPYTAEPGYVPEPEPVPAEEALFAAEAEPEAKPAARKKVVKKAVKKVVKKPAVTAVPVMTGEPEYTAEPDTPYTAEPENIPEPEPEPRPEPEKKVSKGWTTGSADSGGLKDQPIVNLDADEDAEDNEPVVKKKKVKAEVTPQAKRNRIIVFGASIGLIAALTVTSIVIPSFRYRDEMALLRNANVGDIIRFGKYKGNSGWIVLDKKDDRVLCISDFEVGDKPQEEFTWETSPEREELNSSFMNSTFNLYERIRILSSATIREQDPDYKTEYVDKDLNDRMFILKDDEVKKYVADNGDILVQLSDTAIHPTMWISIK